MQTRHAQRGQARSPTFRAVFFGLVLALAVFFLGPVNQFGPDAPAPRAAPPAIEQLDRWLAEQEAAYPDIRPDLQRQVVWHDRPGVRTPWSVVYVHGFVSSWQDTAPLAQRVAEQLGANLYFARLSGHGRTSDALAEASAQDWLADTLEAQAIGQRIGERVLFIGFSTGATLGTWLGQRPEGQAVDAFVFLSPNYGPRDRRSELINQPWGMQLALLLEGEIFSLVDPTGLENNAWSLVYPTRTLFPMMALVEHVRHSDLSTFTAPVLVLYSERDLLVDAQQIVALFPRLGSERKTLLAVDYSEAPDQHVLAGDLRAPRATQRMADDIVRWVRASP
jgi:esterase/lipase